MGVCTFWRNFLERKQSQAEEVTPSDEVLHDFNKALQQLPSSTELCVKKPMLLLQSIANSTCELLIKGKSPN